MKMRLERRLGDLEAGHRRAARDDRREDRRRVRAGGELELGEPGARAGRRATPGSVASQAGSDSPSTPSRTVRAPAGPLQVAERAGRHEPTVIDDGERLAQRLGGLHLVGREDDRPALVAQLEERLAQEGQVDRIEPGERLVHQQDVRVVEDGRDELDLLLVALAQLLGPRGRRSRGCGSGPASASASRAGLVGRVRRTALAK